MSNRSSRTISTSRFGFFQEVSLRVRLILRLMGDKRVNPFLKIIPIASLVYLVSPFDFPGPIDDALVVWLGTYFFVEMCPPGIVQEHMLALRLHVAGSSPDAPAPKEEVIDAEFHDVTGEGPADTTGRPG
jgi:hypothetical protein